MTEVLYLRDLIVESIQATGDEFAIYANEAPEEAEYPYAVFEISTMTGDEIPKAGYLEFNVWDRYPTFSRVDAITDTIEQRLKNRYFKSDAVAFRCFNGDRGHVPDEDKEMKRTRERFIIRYNTRGE